MATISSLPLELLLEIFLTSTRNDHRANLPSHFGVTWNEANPRKSPLLLTHICSDWRTIALRSPLLWSSLYLDWAQGELSTTKDICLTWLGRSGNAPLDLYMEDASFIKRDRVAEEIFKSILPFKGRWRHLGLVIAEEPTSTPHSLIDDTPNVLPLLESLEVQNSSKAVSLWFARNMCPGLQRVSADFGPDQPHIATDTVTWSNLTEFVSSTHFSMEDAVEILRQHPKLQSLTIELDNPTLPTSHQAFGTVTHPALQKLYLKSHKSSAAPFLDMLTVPNLTAFSYDENPSDQTLFPVHAASAFFERSQPPLRQLHVQMNSHVIPPTDMEMVDMLRKVPGVSTLTLTIHGHCASFFGDDLVQKMAKSEAAPSLEFLSVKTLGLLAMSETALKNLATTRPGLDIVIHAGMSNRLKAFLDQRKAGVHRPGDLGRGWTNF